MVKEKEIQMANKTSKCQNIWKMLNISNSQKIQSEFTVRYGYICLRMGKTKTVSRSKQWQDCRTIAVFIQGWSEQKLEQLLLDR